MICFPSKRKHNLQHIIPEASFPLSLVEEVIKVAAKGYKDKTKGKESKYSCIVKKHKDNKLYVRY